jgi:hypothetical protein
MPNVVNGIQNLWLLVLAQQVELANVQAVLSGANNGSGHRS